MSGPPVHVLGVRRSGTTLLRVMLDRSSDLAIPDESYFVPQLASRHSRPVDVDRFLEDLRRLPVLRDWGVAAEDVARCLGPGLTPGEAIAAVFQTYAATRGKSRWGDKTPLYMRHLRTLERLFPDALFVHVIRDGRDAAMSFLEVPEGIMTRSWGFPGDVAGFACQWRAEIEAARRLGSRVGAERYLEVRYEQLVADPEGTLGVICDFAAIGFDATMLDYPRQSDSASKPHQQRLNQPPTVGVRDWRTQMDAADARAFESVAGDLLSALGYPVRGGARKHWAGRRVFASYRLKTAAWRLAGTASQRSPLWRRRHPRLD